MVLTMGIARNQAHQMSGSERYPFNASLSLIVMIRLSTAQDR
jgi:hypothetical protein